MTALESTDPQLTPFAAWLWKHRPRLYRFQGGWWHGCFVSYEGQTVRSAIQEIVWLCRHGQFSACWHYPELVFGLGRDWYDGPIWFVHAGFFSIDLSVSR